MLKNGRVGKFGSRRNSRPNANNPEKRQNSKRTGHSKNEALLPSNNKNNNNDDDDDDDDGNNNYSHTERHTKNT